MEEDSVIDDVRLFRPLLANEKSDIYYIAHIFEIPYLKDSTPDWSCRGVLRRQIMPKLIDQWGTGIIGNLAEIGKQSKEWDSVVNNFVLEPIYKSIVFEKNGCKIELKDEMIPDDKPMKHVKFLYTYYSVMTDGNRVQGINSISDSIRYDPKSGLVRVSGDDIRYNVAVHWIVKQYAEENKDKVKSYQDEYREKNKEKLAEQKKIYREQNKDKYLAEFVKISENAMYVFSSCCFYLISF